MLRTLVILVGAVLLGGWLVSCGENAPPQRTDQQQLLTPPAGGSRTATNAAPDIPPPLIPRDARWTIFCATFVSPGHAQQARQVRNYLIRSTGMHDFYTVAADDQTSLRYGFYKTVDEREDKREAARAKSDLRAITALVSDTDKTKLFNAPFMVNMETDDPSAPAEWNLANAKGVYTVQIGVYKGSPERKQKAIEAVQAARAQSVEAYYFHGPTASSVCIGAWPESAVEKPKAYSEDGKLYVFQAQNSGELVDAVKASRNPEAVPVVVPDSMRDKIGPNARTSDGKPIEIVPEGKVVDPSLLATIERYPLQGVNGLYRRKMMNPRTRQVYEASESSRVVLIPHRDNASVADGTGITVPPPPQPDRAMTPDPTPANPGKEQPRPAANRPGGKLKSLD